MTYVTPFPPEDLWHGEHNVHWAEHHDKYDVLAWCSEHVGLRGIDWWHPVERMIVCKERDKAFMFKLTWG